MNLESLIEDWKSEIYIHAVRIDSRSQELWTSLAYGWALGKGLLQEDAEKFVDEICQRDLI